MKPGEKIECPHCGDSTFLKKVPVMDGWTKQGEILVCALCSKKIEDYAPEEKKEDKDDSVSKLASILGSEKETVPEITASEDEKRFCRDCNHLIEHPFLTRCSLHEKDVNPMDDCPDFVKKEQKKADK